eukprot:TRINITY_DN27976_c0_g1_i1.p1 TRINITY_DN27976_c0_g1~~TRINITY_DN27976_c0_g1_i1.p1  ORF type:complete len:379 (+),score=103.96 TRINITY_DN27976_c0_g1_i1:66-1202(+)
MEASRTPGGPRDPKQWRAFKRGINKLYNKLAADPEPVAPPPPPPRAATPSVQPPRGAADPNIITMTPTPPTGRKRGGVGDPPPTERPRPQTAGGHRRSRDALKLTQELLAAVDVVSVGPSCPRSLGTARSAMQSDALRAAGATPISFAVTPPQYVELNEEEQLGPGAALRAAARAQKPMPSAPSKARINIDGAAGAHAYPGQHLVKHSKRRTREMRWFSKWESQRAARRRAAAVRPRLKPPPLPHDLGASNLDGHWLNLGQYALLPAPPYPKTPRMKKAYAKPMRVLTPKITAECEDPNQTLNWGGRGGQGGVRKKRYLKTRQAGEVAASPQRTPHDLRMDATTAMLEKMQGVLSAHRTTRMVASPVPTPPPRPAVSR